MGSKEWILLTNVYGPHTQNERRVFLQNLEIIRSIYSDYPWIVGGDYNMIKDLNEKKDGLRRREPDMEAFSEWIAE